MRTKRDPNTIEYSLTNQNITVRLTLCVSLGPCLSVCVLSSPPRLWLSSAAHGLDTHGLDPQLATPTGHVYRHQGVSSLHKLCSGWRNVPNVTDSNLMNMVYMSPLF